MTSKKELDLSSALCRLQDWYSSMCNGDWEHLYGVTIENIDNPGWSISIDLDETGLDPSTFERKEVQRASKDNWYVCRISDGKFDGAGGPHNLVDLIFVFLDWVDAQELKRFTARLE